MLPFFSGYVIDKFGARKCIVVYVIFVAIGHVIFTFGLKEKSWTVMFFGRAVFGLGDSSLSVSNLSILATWFGDGKELALALGINLSASRFGSVINNILSPSIASHSKNGVVTSSWFAAFILGGSVASACGVYLIDMSVEHTISGNSHESQTHAYVSYGSISTHDVIVEEEKHSISMMDFLSFSRTFKLLITYGLLIYGEKLFVI